MPSIHEVYEYTISGDASKIWLQKCVPGPDSETSAPRKNSNHEGVSLRYVRLLLVLGFLLRLMDDKLLAARRHYR